MKKYCMVGLIILVALFIFGGCAKKELSKEEAKSILSQNPPGKLLRSIPKKSQGDSVDPTQKTTLEKMQEKGYIVLNKAGGRAAKNGTDNYEVTITSKLAPFVVSEDAGVITLKLADIVIDTVTDIVMKGDEADVGYTTKLQTNQLSEDVFAPVHNPSPGPNHAGLRLHNGKWQ